MKKLILFTIILSSFIGTKAQTYSQSGGTTLLICSDSTVMACGANYGGTLGLGFNSPFANPNILNFTQVIGLNKIVAVTAGEGTTAYALKDDGTVFAWGNNGYGELGMGDTINRNVPIQIPGLSNIRKISAGAGIAFAIDSAGKVWAWGANQNCQLGDSTTLPKRLTPVMLPVLEQIESIDGGIGKTVAMGKNGLLWECNANGGLFAQVFTPVNFFAPGSILQYAVSASYCLVVKSDSTVWGWGVVQNGQLCNGYWMNGFYSPVQLPLSNIVSVRGGLWSAWALDAAGKVWAWGKNNYGATGDGTYANPPLPVPVMVSNLNNVASFADFTSVSCTVFKHDKTIWTWGYNYSGQLGLGYVAPSSPCSCSPVSQVTPPCAIPGCLASDFQYPASGYCIDAGSTVLTVLDSGSVAGTFSASPAGLALADATGAIDISNSAVGNYNITNTIASNYFCPQAMSSSVSLAVNPLPNVSINLAAIDTLCSTAGIVNLIGENPSGGLYSGTGVSGNTFNTANATIGNNQITYTYTDANGCSNTATANIFVDVCSGVNALAKEGVRLYPNPSSGVFNISNTNHLTSSILIYDILGNNFVNLKLIKGVNTINLNEYGIKEGVYFYKLLMDNGNVECGKLLKTIQ